MYFCLIIFIYKPFEDRSSALFILVFLIATGSIVSIDFDESFVKHYSLLHYLKMLTLAAVIFIIFVLEIVILLHVPFSTIFSCFQIAIRFSKVQVLLSLLSTVGV